MARAIASSAAARPHTQVCAAAFPLKLEHTHLISIKEFPAEFSMLDGTGKRTWCACAVVGLTNDPSAPKFVVLIDDGDALYAAVVPEVRRVDP